MHGFSRTKLNVKNEGGARLNSNYELFTIFYHLADSTRKMDQFNFLEKESRNNVVDADAVLQKLKHSRDNKPVNVYQKLRELLDWMVGHFSRPHEWVLDLCSGSGTGLASCMAYGRHCASVEIDLRQAIVLQERVLNLEEREDRNLRTAIQHGELRP
jgi:DNA modification methylase